MCSFINAAKDIAHSFEYTDHDVQVATAHFIEQLSKGLVDVKAKTIQIPTFVSYVPNGAETGTYLAADLGGTNFRVCLVELHGGSKYTTSQSKIAVPPQLMINTSWSPLFRFLADQIQIFLRSLDDDSTFKDLGSGGGALLRLAFTFSFTVEQTSLNMGTLLKWDKGFNIPSAIGMDPCAMLQLELNALAVRVQVVALANDTVGTLLAQQYSAETPVVLGAVFGTGTNGAYLEKICNISKLEDLSGVALSGCTNVMVMNTEWGALDDSSHRLPVTKFDLDLDQASLHPGEQRYEKMVSGMYLGELFRRAVLGAYAMSRSPNTNIDIDSVSARLELSPLPTSLLSALVADHLDAGEAAHTDLEAAIGAHLTPEEVEGMRLIGTAIGNRAARLAGVAIGAVILRTGCLNRDFGHPAANLSTTFPRILKYPPLAQLRDLWSWLQQHLKTRGRGSDTWKWMRATPHKGKIVSVGLDGSLSELYPGFLEGIRSTLSVLEGIGPEGENLIEINVVKDGSSMGSALVARAAELQILASAPK